MEVVAKERRRLAPGRGIEHLQCWGVAPDGIPETDPNKGCVGLCDGEVGAEERDGVPRRLCAGKVQPLGGKCPLSHVDMFVPKPGDGVAAVEV
jgi:hypothetical protein